MADEENEIAGDEEGSESYEPQPPVNEGRYVMRTFIAIAVFVCALSVGWQLRAEMTGTIVLTAEEKGAAVLLAERRQEIQYERQAATNVYQSQMSAIQDKENALNLEVARLGFRLKKSHSIPADVNYRLDEWNGVLKKQDNH